ncbi:MAG: hypothetical protein FWE90_07390 [Defluviitaleaceae bacterium]|nr:hypothetical protein [Defluviitaleaceae bacterium]
MNINHFNTTLTPTLSQNSGSVLMRRQSRLDEMRALRREREMNIQERENEFIKELNERMDFINETELNSDLRKSKLTALADQIEKIYKDRTEREQALSEWETHMQMAEQEKRMQEREEEAERAAENRIKTKDREEIERFNERSDIRGFVKIASQKENNRQLSRTRADMSMEATQLRHAIAFEPGEPGDFRNTQLEKLNQGITRIEMTVQANVANMYRQSNQAGAKAPVGVPEGQDPAEERENDYTSPFIALR